MKGTKVASRYAKSLLMLAVEQNMADEAYADMQRIHATCIASKDLTSVMRSPVINGDKKLSVLGAIFPGLGKLTSGFIRIITTHRREDILPEIASSYISQYKEHKKIVTAEVITAVPLNDNARKKIAESLKKSQGKEVDVVEKVDADLIGGLIVRVGDKQFDGSIARKLNDLRKQFSDNPYVPEF